MYADENPTIEQRVGIITILTADGSVYRRVTVRQRASVNASLFEREALRLVNIERANHGLSPLQWHDGLAVVARNHSIDMVTRGFFSHTCPNGRNARYRINSARIPFTWYSETVSRGDRTPEQAVRGFMNSPRHREIILYPRSTHMGAGFHGFYWTLKFLR